MDDILDLAAVGDILDVSSKTITQYLSDSRPGKRYANHPFPKPDRYIGRSPVWSLDRRGEIEEWSDLRPGRGWHVKEG